jgi:hypothetical protein
MAALQVLRVKHIEIKFDPIMNKLVVERQVKSSQV